MKESQGVEQLSEHKTVRWENLPDLPLYMDQVVTYLERQLELFQSVQSEKLVTASMINNYVKQRFVPKPEKKRYQREQIACLIVYVLLKQVLPLTDIQKGIYLQLALCDRNFQEAYDIFCRQVEGSLSCVSDLAQGHAVDKAVYAEMPLSILGTSMAALSLATKLIAQKVLALNSTEEGEDFDLSKYMQPEA